MNAEMITDVKPLTIITSSCEQDEVFDLTERLVLVC